MRVFVIPAEGHLFCLAEVWGPGTHLSLTTPIGDGVPALFQVAAAQGPPALAPCWLCSCCRAVSEPTLLQAGARRQSSVFPAGQRGEVLPSAASKHLPCSQGSAGSSSPQLQQAGWEASPCVTALAGAGQFPGIRARRVEVAGVCRYPVLPACRAAVPTAPGRRLRASAWQHRPSPAIWRPAAAGCAQRAPRRLGAPPAAAPGAGGPVPPSAPLPGAAGPEAPAGMAEAAWHSPGSPQVCPQPSLPT